MCHALAAPWPISPMRMGGLGFRVEGLGFRVIIFRLCVCVFFFFVFSVCFSNPMFGYSNRGL